MVNETKAVVYKYSKIYPEYDLEYTSINTWKLKCKKNKESTLAKNSGRPNLLGDGLFQNTKDMQELQCREEW